ncbi:hypothetical protein B0F90DRAFT_1768696, partial [Multifurca ochricompacta]
MASRVLPSLAAAALRILTLTLTTHSWAMSVGLISDHYRTGYILFIQRPRQYYLTGAPAHGWRTVIIDRGGGDVDDGGWTCDGWPGAWCHT